MKKFCITEIVGWHEDSWLIDGDASHEGYDSVEECVLEERKLKDRFEDNYPGILPFVCNAKDIDEAIEKLNAKHFEYDYLKVWDVDYDVL